MERFEFEDGVQTLATAYAQKMPPDATLQVWFDFLHRIEGDEWKKTVKRIIRHERSFPRNIVATTLQYADRRVFDLEKKHEDPMKQAKHYPKWWEGVEAFFSPDKEAKKKLWGHTLAGLFKHGELNDPRWRKTVREKMADPEIRKHMNECMEVSVNDRRTSHRQERE